jgi:hypothetical protein
MSSSRVLFQILHTVGMNFNRWKRLSTPDQIQLANTLFQHGDHPLWRSPIVDSTYISRKYFALVIARLLITQFRVCVNTFVNFSRSKMHNVLTNYSMNSHAERWSQCSVMSSIRAGSRLLLTLHCYRSRQRRAADRQRSPTKLLH